MNVIRSIEIAALASEPDWTDPAVDMSEEDCLVIPTGSIGFRGCVVPVATEGGAQVSAAGETMNYRLVRQGMSNENARRHIGPLVTGWPLSQPFNDTEDFGEASQHAPRRVVGVMVTSISGTPSGATFLEIRMEPV